MKKFYKVIGKTAIRTNSKGEIREKPPQQHKLQRLASKYN